jgi:hypothetical protein
MFVSAPGHVRGETAVEITGPPSERFGLRPGERGTVLLDAPLGWACPHCAVENPCSEQIAGDVVECDYCGSAFALPD